MMSFSLYKKDKIRQGKATEAARRGVEAHQSHQPKPETRSRRERVKFVLVSRELDTGHGTLKQQYNVMI